VHNSLDTNRDTLATEKLGRNILACEKYGGKLPRVSP